MEFQSITITITFQFFKSITITITFQFALIYYFYYFVYKPAWSHKK